MAWIGLVGRDAAGRAVPEDPAVGARIARLVRTTPYRSSRARTSRSGSRILPWASGFGARAAWCGWTMSSSRPTSTPRHSPRAPAPPTTKRPADIPHAFAWRLGVRQSEHPSQFGEIGLAEHDDHDLVGRQKTRLRRASTRRSRGVRLRAGRQVRAGSGVPRRQILPVRVIRPLRIHRCHIPVLGVHTTHCDATAQGFPAFQKLSNPADVAVSRVPSSGCPMRIGKQRAFGIENGATALERQNQVGNAGRACYNRLV